MTPSGKAIKELLKRPIAYHRGLAKAAGSVTAGVMLSQAFYWSERTEDPDGWFWKELGEWQEETCLTVNELRGARKLLREKGLLEERHDRAVHRLYWRVDFDRLGELMLPPGHLLNSQPPAVKTTGASCENRNSIYGAENTAEITAETTPGAALELPPSQEPPARARCNGSPDPDDDPPPPPKGGRPAPKRPVDQSAPQAPNLVHSQAAAREPVSAVLDEILRPHPELVQAAWSSAVPLGLVAQAVLEGRDQVEVLAVLLCARAKRARLRSTAAFFRAKVLCRPLGAPAVEPRLCDWTEAKRLLVGWGVVDTSFGRCLRGLDGKSAADLWREAAKARAAAAAAKKRAEDLRRLRRLLPTLRGDRRRRAEQLLARMAS